jgi:hypothetical protein
MNQETIGMNNNLISADHWEQLREGVFHLLGDALLRPSGSIVIPINACEDVNNFIQTMTDIVKYKGKHTFEIITVINNYPEYDPPCEIEIFSKLGLQVLNIPNICIPGVSIPISARALGVEAASSDVIILFDADCRIPNITPLLDHYVEKINSGYLLAYTNVHFSDLPRGNTVPIRVRFHHLARSIKRNVLKIPTSRGSNYAINRAIFLKLYETKKLRHDIQIGPNVKALGGKCSYSDDRNLSVLTSARKMRTGLWRIVRYVLRRLLSNLTYIRDTSAAQTVLKAKGNALGIQAEDS